MTWTLTVSLLLVVSTAGGGPWTSPQDRAAETPLCSPPPRTIWLLATNHKTGTVLSERVLAEIARPLNTSAFNANERLDPARPLGRPPRTLRPQAGRTIWMANELRAESADAFAARLFDDDGARTVARGLRRVFGVRPALAVRVVLWVRDPLMREISAWAYHRRTREAWARAAPSAQVSRVYAACARLLWRAAGGEAAGRALRADGLHAACLALRALRAAPSSSPHLARLVPNSTNNRWNNTANTVAPSHRVLIAGATDVRQRMAPPPTLSFQALLRSLPPRVGLQLQPLVGHHVARTLANTVRALRELGARPCGEVRTLVLDLDAARRDFAASWRRVFAFWRAQSPAACLRAALSHDLGAPDAHADERAHASGQSRREVCAHARTLLGSAEFVRRYEPLRIELGYSRVGAAPAMLAGCRRFIK